MESVEFNEHKNNYILALKGLEEALLKTDLPALENLYLWFTFSIEYDKFKINVTDDRRVITSLTVTKFAQELLGVIGCLKRGSLYGSAHNVRALMELAAVIYYLDADGNNEKQDKRIKKFNAFFNLEKYKIYTILNEKLTNGKITRKEFDEKKIIMEKDIDSFTPDVVEGWKKLWGIKDSDDLIKVKNWHHKSTIENLLKEAFGEYKDLYEFYCHLVHFSPFGPNIAGHGLIMHPNEIRAAIQQIEIASYACFEIIRLLDKWTKSNIGVLMVPALRQIKALQAKS